jgi:hypothetical protein
VLVVAGLREDAAPDGADLAELLYRRRDTAACAFEDRRTMECEPIGVPYASAARPGGIATAIGVLREGSLPERLRSRGDVRDGGDLELLEGSGVRGPSGLLNKEALGRLATATREAVPRSLDGGR